MITTVNMNPCIDRSVMVSDFQVSALNRVLETRIDVCGKGVNVAAALKNLGSSLVCIGLNYSQNKEELENRLQKEGIPYEFVEAQGRIRTNIKVIDVKNHNLTEINERGGAVSAENLEELHRLVRKYAEKSNILVISGSVPGGVTSDIYQKMIENVKDLPVRVVLDAEKELFLNGLKAGPYLVKPNLYELETACGCTCRNHQEIAAAARKVIALGAEVVCVSMGEDGAMIVDREEAVYAPAIAREVKGVVGAGDSMAAGCCLAMEKGLALPEYLRYAMAAAAASLMLEGTAMCRKEDFLYYLDKVKLEKVY